MQATLTNYRQSPRKVRLVVDMVKGKNVPEALRTLSFLPKRGAAPIMKLIASAAANAKANFGIDIEKLFVKKIVVDKGTVLKRFMPRARGSAFSIKKKMSHIEVVLDTKK